MDISQKTLSRIEQDGDSLSLSRLKKISDLLNFDLLSLISFYIKENNIEDIDTISNLIDRTCHQSCNVDSCPYEKIIHRLEAEIEILKKELKYMEDNGKK